MGYYLMIMKYIKFKIKSQKWLILLGLVSLSLNILLINNVFAKNENLKYRVVKYWKSRLTGDVISCYQLEEPKFREMVPLSKYAKKSGLIYKDFEIKKFHVRGDKAIVHIEVTYFLPAFGSKNLFKTLTKDEWKKINKTWYHVLTKNNKEGGDGKPGGNN